MKRVIRIIIILATLLPLCMCSSRKKPDFGDGGDWVASGARAWTLATDDTVIALAVENGQITITSISNPQRGWNWTERSAAVPLMERAGTPDGETLETDWKFDGAYEDKSAAGTKIALRFKNESPALLLTSVWEARPGRGPVEHYMTIENSSGETVTVYKQESLDIDVAADAVPTLWRFHKESYQTNFKGIFKDEMNPGESQAAWTTTFNDANQSGYIPLVFLDVGEQHGLYVGWEWPVGRIRAAAADDGTINVKAGICAFHYNPPFQIRERDEFKTDIEAGGSFYVPSVYIGTYCGDTDVGSNAFKRWFFNYKMPASMRDDPEEPVIQLDDQQAQFFFDVKSWGVGSVKWDYGWWTQGPQIYANPQFTSGEGGWRLSEGINDYLKTYGAGRGFETLPEYTAWLRENGYRFAMYVLFHDAEMELDYDGLSTVGPYAKPAEWFSNRVVTGGHSADLGNADCVSWIKERLAAWMNENGVVTFRSDFEPINMSSDKINRHKYGVDTPYWAAVGFYEILDHLAVSVPGFRFENCGSGGSMKDYATLKRTNVIQFNDTANYLHIRATFYDSSYAVHPTQLLAPINGEPFSNPANFKSGVSEDDYGWRSTILGAVASGSWAMYEPGHYPWEMQTYMEKYFRMYAEKLRPLVRSADLYHILPRPDEINWDGVQYYDPDAGSGVVFLFKPTDEEGPAKEIKLKGLDPDKMYTLTFEDRPGQNMTKTGAELTAGFPVTIEEARGSEIVWIN